MRKVKEVIVEKWDGQGGNLVIGKEAKGQMQVWDKTWEQNEAKWLRTRRANKIVMLGAGWARQLNSLFYLKSYFHRITLENPVIR